MKKIIYLMPFIAVLNACATHTADIQPQYISPMQYQSYSCSQIAQEMSVVSTKVAQVAGEQDKIASNDSAQMGLGLIYGLLYFS